MKTIKEFCEEMHDTKQEIKDFIVIKKYISFEDKIRLAKSVIDFSTDYDRGFVKLDNIKKHLSFTFDVIEAHTDLIFADDWDVKMQQYDVLCQNNLLDAIICEFENDYRASRDVLDMMCADMIAENSIDASIAKLVQSASENLDVFVGALADKLEDIDIEKIIPKDLDLDKLKGFLGKLK